MVTVTVDQAEVAPLAPTCRSLPALDRDEVCRELAEALAHIEVLPFLYPDEITPGSST